MTVQDDGTVVVPAENFMGRPAGPTDIGVTWVIEVE